MKAEIIAVGSELLLGQIANTNAQFISKQLQEIGIDVYYHSVVGDNPIRLKSAIELAESRVDLIIFSGGLGPTKDDLTKQTIAEHLSKTLVYDENAMQTIEKFFSKISRPMTENNKQQALVLQNCTVLTNHHGLAPGMYYETPTHKYVLLPGPPKELHPMFIHEAKPILIQKQHSGARIISHVLRFYGIGEAELETKLLPLLEAQSNPTIAPLASDGEVTIRITAKATTEQEAWDLINKTKQDILMVVGEYFYGIDNETLQYQVIETLKELNMTISAAESLTAGLFLSELAEIPGAGSVIHGGVVTYSIPAKVQQLEIDGNMIKTYGVVSKEVAESMAEHVQRKFGTSIGIGLTGVAGPEDQDGIPVGTVWIGFKIEDKPVQSIKLSLNGSRNTNRLRTVKKACSVLLQMLKNR